MSASRDALERDQVARIIRTAFARRKSVELKRTYKPSPRHDGFENWRKAADLALELGADPEVFVEAAFEGCALKGGPFPNSMGGQAARSWWTRYRARLPDNADITTNVTTQTPSGPVITQEIRNMTTAEMDLSGDIELAEISLRHVTGSPDARTPAALEFLRSPFTPVLPYVRVFLTHPDPFIRCEFGAAALDYFNHRPSILKAAEGLGFPVAEIIEYLHDRPS